MEVQKKHQGISFGESLKKTSIVVFVLMIMNVIWNLALHPDRFNELVHTMGAASQPMWQLILIAIATLIVLWLAFSRFLVGSIFCIDVRKVIKKAPEGAFFNALSAISDGICNHQFSWD